MDSAASRSGRGRESLWLALAFTGLHAALATKTAYATLPAVPPKWASLSGAFYFWPAWIMRWAGLTGLSFKEFSLLVLAVCTFYGWATMRIWFAVSGRSIPGATRPELPTRVP